MVRLRDDRQVDVVVGSDGDMSTLYERWKPAVGDRVRVVMRDETGAAEESGPAGTIVEIRQGAPYVVCDVEYESDVSGQAGRRQTHAESDLVPIERTSVGAAETERVGRQGTQDVWQPTVGDRVSVASSRRAGTITAIDARGSDTICEVEYDHRPGELAEPERESHPVTALSPTQEPSAEASAGISA